MPTTDDVRERLLDEVRGGLSIRQAAARVGVSLGSATKWARDAKVVKGKAAQNRSEIAARKVIADADGRQEAADALVKTKTIAVEAKAPRKPARSEAERREDYQRRLRDLRQAYLARRAGVVEAVARGLSVEAAAAKLGIAANAAARMVKQEEFERRRPELERQILAALESGLSLRQAADQAGIGVGTAGRWAKAAGAPGVSTRIRHGREKREAVLRALSDGLSLKQAAAHAGVSIFLARQWSRGSRKED